jgi:hypothetical protein
VRGILREDGLEFRVLHGDNSKLHNMVGKWRLSRDAKYEKSLFSV